MNDVFVFLILLLAFIAGAAKNIQRSRQRLYKAELPMIRKIEAAAAVILLLVVTMLGGSQGVHYMLALMAAAFIVSGVTSAGIHPEGILYFHGTSALPKIETWEEIKEVKVEEEEEALLLHFQGKRGHFRQKYPKDAAKELRQMIKKHT